MSAVGEERVERVRRLGLELAGFLLAGGAAYATDLGLFAWLRTGGGAALGGGLLTLGPLTAKAVSSVAACAVAYTGMRLGPYRRRESGRGARGLLLFCAVQAAAALVQLGCLGVSHYLLGLTSPRADVLAGNVIGMALATLLRFWGTRSVVFRRAEAGG
ncbi:GtrA family protein [Phaeacidiphilus oryzae]|uniref:GtrA family protein n=1 Tax=Phaeacidiphilus oryzae TaxID=348818 RepID=UPI000691AE50|nr:GtrA family protein [Phaeacidiphilus oryzae]